MSYDYTDTTNVQALFKTMYGKLAEATFNTMFPFLSQVKKVEGFGGKNKEFPIPLTFGGSVGAGSLPEATLAKWSTATITRKKVYGRLLIDRETIHAAKSDKAAFVRGTREYVRKTVESYTRNTNRILFGPGNGTTSGLLGTTTVAAPGGTALNPTIVISDATFHEAVWEENDVIQLDDAGVDTTYFRIDSVAVTSPHTLTLTRVKGTQDATALGAAAYDVYMQNSQDNEPYGLKGVCDATSGSLYGITVQRRWQSLQKAAAGEGIGPDLLNEQVIEMIRRTGRQPSHIVMSPLQYRKYKDQLEDQKRYSIRPTDKRFNGLISFGALEFLGDMGSIPILMDRFVEDDRVYLLNTRFIEMHRAPGFGWFDDDGTVLLRSADADSYEARYGGYWELYINPVEQGVITGLDTSL